MIFSLPLKQNSRRTALSRQTTAVTCQVFVIFVQLVFFFLIFRETQRRQLLSCPPHPLFTSYVYNRIFIIDYYLFIL